MSTPYVNIKARVTSAGQSAAGCSALIVVGLLHYRETQRGEIHWVVFGLAVLAGAGVVHWWLARAVRRQLT